MIHRPDPLPPSLARLTRRPRHNDPYRQYIRRKHHRWHARPVRDGTRYYLGTFGSYHDARRAVVRFLRGEIDPLPKFVRGVHADGSPCHFTGDAVAYVADVRTPAVPRFRSPPLPTAAEASAAAAAHLRGFFRRFVTAIGAAACEKLVEHHLRHG